MAPYGLYHIRNICGISFESAFAESDQGIYHKTYRVDKGDDARSSNHVQGTEMQKENKVDEHPRVLHLGRNESTKQDALSGDTSSDPSREIPQSFFIHHCSWQLLPFPVANFVDNSHQV